MPRVEVRKEVQPPNTEDTFAHLTAEINQWKDANTRKAEEIKIAHARIANLQQDLSTSVSQNSELQRRNESLARDLEGARLFLNTADKFSDSEVIQILQKLNAELQHTSTSMAERVVSVFELDAVTSDPEQQIMVDKATESIGSTLVQFLRTARRDDFIEMHLQIAFQAYLTSYLCWIVSSWTLDEGRSAFINVLYERLRETGKDSIFEDDQIPVDVQDMINREANDIWTLAFPHACLCSSYVCQRTKLPHHPHHCRAFPHSPCCGLCRHSI